MKYFPIFVELDDRRVLVAGGTEQAAQKVRLLLKSTARITVVAESVCAELKALARIGRIETIERAFLSGDLKDAALVFVAGDDPKADSRIAALARERNIPVNVVDRPRECSFITPAIVDRDPVIVAIGTEGTSPVLAQGIKARLESVLPHRLGALARKAGRLRPRVACSLRSGAHRRAFWRDFFFGHLRKAFLAGDRETFDAGIEHALLGDGRAGGDVASGRVALVGAGPGDPELLTLRAQRLLQDADIIVHDRLVADKVLEYARRDAERVVVGKTPGRPSPSQAEINDLLVAEARAGKQVVRLKGGDPYVFGRGGEEQAALEEAGIAVEIVPGITAATACAASIGLPLTVRGRNRAFTVLTGMTEAGTAEHDWQALARPGTAFAVYMGIAAAADMQRRLLDAGIDPETPAVVVENGTLPCERSVLTPISKLDETLQHEAISTPAIIFVGLEPTAETRVRRSRWAIAAGEKAGSTAARRLVEAS